MKDWHNSSQCCTALKKPLHFCFCKKVFHNIATEIYEQINNDFDHVAMYDGENYGKKMVTYFILLYRCCVPTIIPYNIDLWLEIVARQCCLVFNRIQQYNNGIHQWKVYMICSIVVVLNAQLDTLIKHLPAKHTSHNQ